MGDSDGECKQQILRAAQKVFLKKGFAAARMEEIAASAGLSIGGVYWYYPGKEEVILDLMDEVTQADLGGLRALLEAPGTLRERLQHYIQVSWPPAQALAPLFHEIYSRGGRDRATRLRLRDYFRAYRAALAALLEQGVQRGELRPLDLPQAATACAALYEGMLELSMFDPDHVPGAPELAAALDILLRGLRPESA